MGINLDPANNAPQAADFHPDDTKDYQITRADLKEGPAGGSNTDEPVTDPTPEELASVPDAPVEPIYDDKEKK